MYSTFCEVDLIKPAVQGTLVMLKGALKNGYAPYICVFILTFVVKISGASYRLNILLVTTTNQVYPHFLDHCCSYCGRDEDIVPRLLEFKVLVDKAISHSSVIRM